jgi:hypothetical protein
LLKANATSERPLKMFLRGTRFGMLLGAVYAVGLTLQRYGLSADAFFTVEFLIRAVLSVGIGFIFNGAWALLSEVILRRYESSRPVKEGSYTPSRAVMRGVIRFGLPMAFYVSIANTFGKPGISLNTRFWLQFLVTSCIYLIGSIPMGAFFGLFMEGVEDTQTTGQGSSD